MAGNANSGPRKAKVWRDTLMLVLNRPADEPLPAGKTNLERVITKQVIMAMDGDSASIRDIADRIDGKPAQAIVGGDEDDNPVRAVVNLIRLAGPEEANGGTDNQNPA